MPKFFGDMNAFHTQSYMEERDREPHNLVNKFKNVLFSILRI